MAIKNASLYVAHQNHAVTHSGARYILWMVGLSDNKFGFISAFSGARSQIWLLLISGWHKTAVWFFPLPSFFSLINVFYFVFVEVKSSCISLCNNITAFWITYSGTLECTLQLPLWTYSLVSSCNSLPVNYLKLQKWENITYICVPWEVIENLHLHIVLYVLTCLVSANH